jgi:hypothetical protein
MPSHLNTLVLIAMFAVVLFAVARGLRTGQWPGVILDLSMLFVFGFFLNRLFGFPYPADGNTIPKDGQEDLTLLAVLAACMILGMLAQVFYQHFSLPRAQRVRRKIDWGLFLAPVFASPIVFIPLMVALQDAKIDFTAMTIPRMMIFLVAFQNGFFWKGHFDRQRKDVELNSQIGRVP